MTSFGGCRGILPCYLCSERLRPRRDPGLQHEALTVFRSFDVETSDPTQHLLSHVGQDEPATSELRPVVHERSVVEVVPGAFLQEVAFADEEVGPVRGL